jgi:hypothetical protein
LATPRSTRSALALRAKFRTRWFAFPNRQVIVDLEIPVTRCAFPAAGRYLFELCFEAETIASRWFDARLA